MTRPLRPAQTLPVGRTMMRSAPRRWATATGGGAGGVGGDASVDQPAPIDLDGWEDSGDRRAGQDGGNRRAAIEQDEFPAVEVAHDDRALDLCVLESG